MTHREQMLRALEFSQPDRIPVFYHRSPAGLFKHGQRLLDLFRAYPPDNYVPFERVPQPPPGTVSADGTYCEVWTDEWGTEWEHRVFGLQGAPRGYPLRSLEDADAYTLPEAPSTSDPGFAAERELAGRLKADYLLFDGWIILFEKLLELLPPEEVYVGLAARDRRLLGLLDRVGDYWLSAIDHLLVKGADVIMFGDDWGTQHGPMVSPAQFRSLFSPWYRRLFEAVKSGGAKVLFHSCGRLDGIFDEIADLEIDCIWHQVNCYDAAAFAAECRRRRIAAFIHPDRQRLVPHGRPAEIREYIRAYADLYRSGGGIFYVEIENDAPFENAEALIKAVHEFA